MNKFQWYVCCATKTKRRARLYIMRQNCNVLPLFWHVEFWTYLQNLQDLFGSFVGLWILENHWALFLQGSRATPPTWKVFNGKSDIRITHTLVQHQFILDDTVIPLPSLAAGWSRAWPELLNGHGRSSIHGSNSPMRLAIRDPPSSGNDPVARRPPEPHAEALSCASRLLPACNCPWAVNRPRSVGPLSRRPILFLMAGVGFLSVHWQVATMHPN